MEKIPNGKYTKEVREEAIDLVTVKCNSVDYEPLILLPHSIQDLSN